MRALRYYQPGKIEIDSVPCPQIGPGEVLVKVSACGVCATDIKTYLHGHPKIKPGSVLGHEISGIIVEVNQTPTWREGMRVAVAPYVPCFQCDQCARGNFTQCSHLMDVQTDPGGFAEYVRVPARIVNSGLVVLPDQLSLLEATLAEPLACCIHGLEALKLNPLDRLLIIGDGPMGLLQAEAARAMQVKQIIVAGMTPDRLARAARIADVVIRVGETDMAAAVQAAAPGGADKVLVSVGNADVAQTAFRYVHKGGIINLFAGLPKEATLTINPGQIHYDEVTVMGTFGFAPAHFKKAVEWLAKKRIHTEGIITATVPLSDAKRTLQEVAEYRGIKSIITFSDKEELMGRE
ncbi:MAG: alcohol dehydrogenase catalytic domain-containing protein [Anaerolineaceae bacterium]|nr:alcohol dehydrogenase catalytic domain-containing protein [Anaerolineaceae bacterium]